MTKKKTNERLGTNKLKAKSSASQRIAGTRTERTVGESEPLIVISFKDWDNSQGQTFEQWQTNGLLAKLMTKLVEICQKNRTTASQEKIIDIYGDFPADSKFRKPQYIETEVKWGTIRNIGGQKARVAGYMIDNVFYVVFLDQEHKFAPSSKN